MTDTSELTETQKAYNVAQHEMFQLAAYGHHRYHPSGECLTNEGKRQQRDYLDRIRTAREELEAAVLRLVAEHAERAGSRMASADWLRCIADDPAELSLLAVSPEERHEAAVSAVVEPPADQTAPSHRAALRDRITTAISKWHRDPEQPLYEQGADAVLAVLYREWPWLRAEAEDAQPADQTAVTPPPTLTEEGRLRARVQVLEEDADHNQGLAKVGARCMREGHQGLIESGRATVEGHRFALSVALGLGTGAPWDSIHERVKVLAVLPEAADRAAALREAADTAEKKARLLPAEWGGHEWGDRAAEGARAVATELRRMADETATRSDLGTEFVQQADRPDEAGLAAWESDLADAIASCPGRELSPNPCRCPCCGCQHHCGAHQPESMADETATTEAPWPTVTDFSLEVWEGDTWVGVTFKRKTLDEARERRESFRRRFPEAQLRIVRWDETSTVVEADPEPAAGVRQDGAHRG